MILEANLILEAPTHLFKHWCLGKPANTTSLAWLGPFHIFSSFIRYVPGGPGPCLICPHNSFPTNFRNHLEDSTGFSLSGISLIFFRTCFVCFFPFLKLVSKLMNLSNFFEVLQKFMDFTNYEISHHPWFLSWNPWSFFESMILFQMHEHFKIPKVSSNVAIFFQNPPTYFKSIFFFKIHESYPKLCFVSKVMNFPQNCTLFHISELFDIYEMFSKHTILFWILWFLNSIFKKSREYQSNWSTSPRQPGVGGPAQYVLPRVPQLA